MTLRIVLAEDHQIVREGLRALLRDAPGHEVVGETGDGLAIEPLVAQHRPDVLVADLVLPGLNGIEATRRVRKRHPDTRVVVLSMHADEPFVVEALAAGASAYVLKDTTATELLRAIAEAAAGRRYLSAAIAAALPGLDRGRPVALESGDPYEALTDREREVLQLVAEGLTSRGIAGRLGLSPRTVESHRANLIAKLRTPSTAGLVRFAAERGLLPPAPLPGGPRRRG
ncbi:MAG: response regulator transcription factor [Vicinamibacteria bacterium]